MRQEKRQTVGIGFLLAAAVFLWNPSFNAIDFLPDFIGYLCMVKGLSLFADINESIATAKKLFTRMAWISVIDVILFVWNLGVSNQQSRATNYLLIPFVVYILTLIFVLPAYRHLFDGMLYLGTKWDGIAVFRGKKKADTREKSSVSDRLCRCTWAFIIVKPLLELLPELSSLTLADVNSGISSTYRGIYQYITMFRFVSLFVVLPVCLVWLLKTIGYWRAVQKDTAFISHVAKAHEQDLEEHSDKYRGRILLSGLTLTVIAAAFVADLNFSDYNVIPDVIAAVLGLLAIQILRSVLARKQVGRFVVLSVAYAVTSVADWCLHTYFLSEYSNAGLAWATGAQATVYAWTCVSSVLSAVCCVLWICDLSWDVLTGIFRTDTERLSPSGHTELTQRIQREEYRTYRIRTVLCTVGACLMATEKVAFRFLSPYVSWSAWMEFGTDAIFLVFWLMLVLDLIDRVKNRYELDL